MVFEKGRGLRETLPGRLLGDGDGDGGGSSLANTADPRRGNRRAVVGVELVDDDLAVVRLVPEWSNKNCIICRSIIINSMPDICIPGKNRLPTVFK